MWSFFLCIFLSTFQKNIIIEHQSDHSIAGFINTNNTTTKHRYFNGFILRLIDACSRSLCSRNIDPLNLRPWDWNSLYAEFVENFIRQFIILLNKSKAGEARIHAERYELLLSNVIDDTERGTNQAAEKISHNRELKTKRLTDNAANMCAKQIAT